MKYCMTNARCGYRNNGICRDERFCPSSFTLDTILKLSDALLFWQEEGEPKKVSIVEDKINHMKNIISIHAHGGLQR